MITSRLNPTTSSALNVGVSETPGLSFEASESLAARFKPEAMQAPGLVLYALTLLLQVPGALARAVIVELSLGLLAFVTHWPIPVKLLMTVCAVGPLVVSLLTVICPWLICPIAGRWWEMHTGGRPPEEDEREALRRVIVELQRDDQSVRMPDHWFVAESAGSNAGVCANSLSVDRGLLEIPEESVGVIAHEYEHLRSGDGRLTCALNLQLLWAMDTPQLLPLRTLLVQGVLWFASGQAALWFTGNSWEAYWRAREYAADDYAISVGQGPALAGVLERDALPFERPERRKRYSLSSHPYTKPRIVRLRGIINAAAEVQ
jgi:Zn-dependent protease with chaperone function